MEELVSIIVPVYNAHGFLSRCVDSLISQTYPTLQILLVDDGSTDGSGGLCDAYAKRDGRVEVVHQANGGVSAARNAGLDRARGAWIAFVDADDYVSPYYIKDMYDAAQGGSDIAICRFLSVPHGDAGQAPFLRTTTTRIITGRDACVQRFGREVFLYNSCWGKLFRAHLWKGLRFPALNIGEDLFVSHALLYRAGSVAITNAYLYAYVQSGGSLIRGAYTPRRFDALDAWQEGVHFYTAAGDHDLAHIARRVYCSRTFDALCICKKILPREHEVIHRLRLRAIEARRDAKPIRGYIDCSRYKAFAYRIKFFLGRWCPPLYKIAFVRGRVDL